MTGYKLATYQSADGPRAGVILGDMIFDAERLTSRYTTVLGILEDWDNADEMLRDASTKAARDGKGQPLQHTQLRAPVLWPSAIYCAGANYSDHAAEMARRANRPPEPDPKSLGLKPWHFIKASRSLADPGATVSASHYTQKLDWEVELAAVIGKTAKNVTVEQALDHVAGYTAANDLSARDLSRRPHVSETSAFKSDWIGQKSFDGACPLGPWIVPAQDIPEPQNLAIKLWVNDVLKQDSNTGNMIFNIAEQISHLSMGMTLHPGDVILTGTPAGVGSARNEFLQPGDVVKIEIERVGALTNTIA
jgi:2-keto-4-pentenoate hydratase/2-oxohepta-3-ene-1,7-dioic acid hydratase in catechol pathway